MRETKLTTKQAAEVLGVCADSVRKYCQDGRIDGALRVGKMWLIPSKSLKKGIEKRKPGPKAPVAEEATNGESV